MSVQSPDDGSAAIDLLLFGPLQQELTAEWANEPPSKCPGIDSVIHLQEDGPNAKEPTQDKERDGKPSTGRNNEVGLARADLAPGNNGVPHEVDRASGSWPMRQHQRGTAYVHTRVIGRDLSTLV